MGGEEVERSFKHEVAARIAELGYPRIIRKVDLTFDNRWGTLAIKGAEEDLYIVDKKRKRVIYTTDSEKYGEECYTILGSDQTVCFPKKPVTTDPRAVSKEPLQRDPEEEFVIATEEALEDDTALAHFSYYCRTRGGYPLLIDEKERVKAVCVGGYVHKYVVESDSPSDEVLIATDLDYPAKALVLYYLGGDYADAMDETKIIVPSSSLRKYGILVKFV